MEMIFLVLITCYLVYRLWSVLGKETDEDYERRGKKISFMEEETNNIVQIPIKKVGIDLSGIEGRLKPGAKMGLEELKKADPDFNLNYFLNGAKAAYEIIITAFAEGDKEALKPLLTKKVFGQFESAIDERNVNKYYLTITIERFERIDIDSIEFIEPQVTISVRFKNAQVRIMSAEDGVIIDNPAKISTVITDVWTFTRLISSNKGSWHLAATTTETTAY